MVRKASKTLRRILQRGLRRATTRWDASVVLIAVCVAMGVACTISGGPVTARIGAALAVICCGAIALGSPERLRDRFGTLLGVLPAIVGLVFLAFVKTAVPALALAFCLLIAIAAWCQDFHAPVPPLVRNLPGADSRSVPQFPATVRAFTRWGLAAGVWGTALCALVGAGTAGFAWGAGWCLAMALPAVIQGVRNRAAGRSIRRALDAYSPVFAMPYAGGAIFHIEMWERYIRAAGLPYIIVTMQERTLDLLAEATDVPIIVPAEASVLAVRETMPASLKAAFYVHNSGLNTLFFAAAPGVVDVFLHHGDGDKQSSSNPKSRKYDILYVAGQGAIDRYAMRGINIPREKFVIGGRPQTETIEVADRGILGLQVPTVLYAPTWAGRPPNDHFSSLPWGPRIVQQLLDRGARIIFRPHPVSRRAHDSRAIIESIEKMLERATATTGIEHIYGAQAETQWGVTEVTNASDAMVSDVSGIVTDYMQSGKPFAMVTTNCTVEQFRAQYPTSRGAYVISLVEPQTMESALDDMFGPDTLHDLRWRQRDYYLGGFNGDLQPSQAFVGLLNELANDQPITLDPSGFNS
ncbi:CDP-glycerol glycerophosphotransferase (TagB/SpsB family) [Rarobacter incanus]|uniref:CDP-glycerol glycerophosphotransferase (TagB/SpsB family) n=2 Tax=Rarobacter incanus TaxID=153494 RepID=A0A542SNU8_9MICO|nr:CDP-glycerol glycerophosphotransferase (TagB/SpsB family) [Rarobacter incanus]